ncbi:DUF4386 domain-containing protein [Kocuria sp.]|uniref:DUF4386 domain-containing protein n=1 Tax=Kocuria sp. TaxID=1871328 RepID=UPI002811370D|nr:DUF4386 domain-containing protein [Kocuria sp.]
MAVTDRTSATTRAPMAPERRTALIAGTIYLLTFVSIPTLDLYAPVHAPGFVQGPGPDTPVLIGAALEIVVALACIGTAVVLHPVLKRVDEAMSLGLVAARTLEAAIIFAGVACLLTVVSLRQAGAGEDAVVAAGALVRLRDWTFLTGQGFLPAVNALLLGSLLYRARLVPRILPVLGFIGAPLLIASATATMFGLWEQVSVPAGLAALPIALWEFSLGLWLVLKGFTPSPSTTGPVTGCDVHA